MVGETYRLDDILGSVELHHRWSPCECGNEYCGAWINWSVDIDRHGVRKVNPEWLGCRLIMHGSASVKPKSIIERLKAWHLS